MGVSMENVVLSHHRYSQDIPVEEAVRALRPYWKDLTRVGRTQFLFVGIPGNGGKPIVTGYATDTTADVTLNPKIMELSKVPGSRWTLFKRG
jgi:hypothetical protein